MKVNIPRTGVDVRTLVERQIRGCDRFLSILKGPPRGEPGMKSAYRPVLTVSGTAGSGRESVAMALCEEFGYQLVGRELMNDVASDLNCQRELLESLDERALSNITVMFESWLRGREIENQDYIGALFRVMGSLSERGGFVILGRGGAFVLREKAGVRIFVDAPLDVRVRRIMEGRNVGEDEARRFIEEKDRDQDGFWRRHFRQDVGNPSAFDLIVNTERIEPAVVVSLVRTVLVERGYEMFRT